MNMQPTRLDDSWAVVRAVPKKEFDAVKEMEKRGMSAYCPTYSHEVKDRRSKKYRVRKFPLFVGWLFVKASSIDWYGLARCKAVAQVLTGVEGNPLTVSSDMIEEILTNETAGKWDKFWVHGEMVKPGVKVGLEGLPPEFSAVVDSVKNERAVGLIVRMFNREVPARAPADRLLRKG